MTTRSAIILTLLFLLAVTPVFAVSISFNNAPSSVDESQEFELDVSLSCTSCGDSYLRGAFFPSGTNYFGFTQNNQGSWINTSGDKTQYFKVASSDLVEGSWSGKLKVKPDPSDSHYNGPGSYSFKVGRYTSSDSSATWAPEVAIAITGPSPTPTSTSTPTNAPIATPTTAATPTATNAPQSTATNTPTPASNAASPTPTPTKTPTIKPSPSKTPTETERSANEISQRNTQAPASNTTSPEGEVLGEQTASEESAIDQKKKMMQSVVIALLFIGAGLALLALVFIWQKRNALLPAKHNASDDILR